MALGKLPVPGRPTIWMTVGQGPIMLAIGAVGLSGRFYSRLFCSPLSPSLSETARYRLKYCLNGPLSPTHRTNQPIIHPKIQMKRQIRSYQTALV